MRILNFLIFMFAVVPQLQSCTASAPNDGVCVRSCGNRPVGGGRVYGTPLSDATTIKNCKVGQELNPITYRFFVYEDMKASNTTSGDKPSSTDAQFPPRIGKAGVAITPLVDGYNRLDTPASDLCTDSCGFAEVTFTPTCYEQDVSIGIISTGMIFDDGGPPKIKFTISME